MTLGVQMPARRPGTQQVMGGEKPKDFSKIGQAIGMVGGAIGGAFISGGTATGAGAMAGASLGGTVGGLAGGFLSKPGQQGQIVTDPGPAPAPQVPLTQSPVGRRLASQGPDTLQTYEQSLAALGQIQNDQAHQEYLPILLKGYQTEYDRRYA